MDTVPKPKRPRSQGQRSWTDAQRAEQAAKLRARKIWTKSTGPRTTHGKSISRLNALTHGGTSRPAKAFMAHFRHYHALLRICFQKKRELLQIQKNELIDTHRKNRQKRRNISRQPPYNVCTFETEAIKMPRIEEVFKRQHI